MTLINTLAPITLVLACYVAALHRSLMMVRPSALERRLVSHGRDAAAQWLLDRRHACLFATAFLRIAFRLTFFGLVLWAVVDGGETTTLTVTSLLAAGAGSAVLLWLFSAVLSDAIARHAGTAVVYYAMPLLKVLTLVGLPLARLLSFVDEMVRRLSGASPDEDAADAVLLRSIEQSQAEGTLDPDAAELLENVVEFRSTDVGEVMTPRTDIDGIELTDDLATIRKFIMDAGHSRIPVYEGNLDNIIGILYVKDLIPFLGEDASTFELRKLLRQPIRVPVTKSVRELLADFRQKIHLALVIDEYGGTAGLVTIEDVLEELVGEIQDEHDPENEELPTFTAIDEKHAEVDGRYHIDDLNEMLDLGLPEDEEFDTVAGFVLASLGRVPEQGASFESHNAKFTAIETSPTHVKKVEIELLTPVRINGDAGK